MARRALRIGTRGSELALVQARLIQRELAAHARPSELVIIQTRGDRVTDRPLNRVGGSGLFIKEIESALLDRRIDLAVHSMKDVPSFVPEGLTLAATTERLDARDVLVSREASSVLALPDNAAMATGSLRRRSQLLALRPDLCIEDLRGNVPTRLRKFEGSEWEAIVLASAGLERLGLADERCHPIPVDEIVPAVGQGALALQARTDDADVLDAVAPMNHVETAIAVSAERAFLTRLEGGCQVPLGAFARVEKTVVSLLAFVGSTDGKRILKRSESAERAGAGALGTRVAESMLAEGADELIRDSGAVAEGAL